MLELLETRRDQQEKVKIGVTEVWFFLASRYVVTKKFLRPTSSNIVPYQNIKRMSIFESDGDHKVISL